MGWYHTNNASKKEIVQQILTETTATVLAHSVKGNTMWTVERSNGETDKGQTFIGCYRLSGGSRRNPGYGYKPMDETMGPCFYDVPQKFLDMQPVAHNTYSAEWRVKVKAYQAAQVAQRELVKNVTVGCRIQLKPEFGGGMTLDVVAVSGKKIRACANGRTYGVAPRMIAAILIQPEISTNNP